ncbi:uncharacterized protein LOC132612657 [Lycium barbarum]|uniref:uncharacterized protein LOC132612657 n=1 Tax=Lycium barbarum TaxID=112863 RepID=UPI00293F5B6B|nr:uncharacterized protein LOC132612657 [Lycium barbarum]
MWDFPNALAYCQRLKTLADQPKSVGAPVTDNRLVLQLVVGLTEAYKNVGTHIRQSKPLPPFSEARSSLCLEEKALAEMNDDSPAAMVAASHREFDDSASLDNSSHSHHNRGKNNHKNRGSGGGGGNRHGSGRSSGETQQVPVQQQWQNPPSPWPWGWMPHWAPPCPYPTTQWARPPSGPTRMMAQPGILGSRPQQQVQ